MMMIFFRSFSQNQLQFKDIRAEHARMSFNFALKDLIH